jgi:carbon monoxide dehydrogenase subunit G
MKISGRQLLPVDQEVIWTVLHDPLAIKEIIPGCESVEIVGPEEFRVTLTLRVGTLTDRFTGLLQLHQASTLSELEFLAEGESPNGLVSCRGRCFLESQSGVDTAVCYEADIEAGGRLAQLSPRLLETTARAFARRCQEGLEKNVSHRTRTFTTSTTRSPLLPELQPGRMTGMDRIRRGILWVAIPLGIFFLLRFFERRRVQLTAERVIEMVSPPQQSDPLTDMPDRP